MSFPATPTFPSAPTWPGTPSYPGSPTFPDLSNLHPECSVIAGAFPFTFPVGSQGKYYRSKYVWSNGVGSPLVFWGAAVGPIAPAPAGPTLIFTEPFTYANGSIATSSGGLWIIKEGTISIDTNRVTAGTHTDYAMAYRNTVVAANQRAELTLPATGAASHWMGPAVRVQAGSVAGFYVITRGTELDLDKVVAGVHTNLQFDVSANISSGHKLAIEVSGTGAATRIKVQVDTGGGWVDKWTNIDPSASIDSGFVGVAGWNDLSQTFGDNLLGYNL